MGIKFHIPSHQVNTLSFFLKTGLDGEDRLRNSGKHAFLKSIEFVEAAPGTDLAETDENTTHCIAIESFITIED